MADTPKAGLPELAAAQAGNYLTHNRALRFVEAILQGNVKSQGDTSPPGSPADGDTYILGASPTGAWAGHGGAIAYYLSTAWVFLTPVEGWQFWVQDEDLFYRFVSGTTWFAMEDVADFAGRNEAVLTNSQVIGRFVAARGCVLPANFAGSYAKAGAAATGSTTIDVKKNGSSVGSIVFAASGTSATFSTSGGTAVTLAVGDVLTVVGPGTADATLAQLGFTLRAYRNYVGA